MKIERKYKLILVNENSEVLMDLDLHGMDLDKGFAQSFLISEIKDEIDRETGIETDDGLPCSQTNRVF